MSLKPPIRRAAAILALAAPLPALVGLETLGLDMPGLREAVAFVALFLVPGALVLYILRIRDIDGWEFLVYACGLSLAFIMALGLVVNAFQGLGVARPLSSVPLVIAIGAATAVLAALALWRQHSPALRVSLGELLKPHALLPLLPLALVILGTQVVNARQDNTLLLAAIALLALLPLAVLVPGLLPERSYPWAVVAIGLALLLHRSLISRHLTGYDVHGEYYFASQVLENGFWDRGVAENYNWLLSVVMVPPVYSALSGIELLWVYKAVYPVLFSLMPLAIFLASRGPLGPRAAFLAACFFMFTQPFYQTMPHQARMQIAMLFLALLLLATTVRTEAQATALRLIFAAGLVVSHYSVAFLTIPVLLMAAIVMQTLPALAPRALGGGGNLTGNPQAKALPSRIVAPNFVSLFTVWTLFWYIYVSMESQTFNDAVRTILKITENLHDDFLSPGASEGLSVATQALTPWRQVTRYLHFGFQLLMFIGVVLALARWRRGPFPRELVMLALLALLMNGASVLVPYFAASIDLDRVYVLTLVFLSPFAIAGGLAVFQGLGHALRVAVRGLDKHRPRPKSASPAAAGAPTLLALGLGVYLLLNVGFVYEIVRDRPNAIPLSRNWTVAHGSEEDKLAFFAAYPMDEDFAGAQWLASYRRGRLPIYADLHGRSYVLRDCIPMMETLSLEPDTALDRDAYLFLRSLNTQDGIMSGPYEGWTYKGGRPWWPLASLDPKLQVASMVYDNGGSRIYFLEGIASTR